MKLTLVIFGFILGYFAFQALWSLLNLWLKTKNKKDK